jgi:anti-anti-sigma regulatory factor
MTMLIIGLDRLAAIDDEAMSAIIVALRRVRETGGTIRLVTRNAHHHERLSIAGLDRIFEVFGSIDDAQPDRASGTACRLTREFRMRKLRAIGLR